MKALLLTAALMLTSCASQNGLRPLSSAGSDVATEGSLANEQLTRDTTAAIHEAVKGTETITKFVIQQPAGPAGRKAWREVWIYDPQNRPRAFSVTFQEDGTGSANFTIKEMKTEPAKRVPRTPPRLFPGRFRF